MKLTALCRLFAAWFVIWRPNNPGELNLSALKELTGISRSTMRKYFRDEKFQKYCISLNNGEPLDFTCRKY